MSAGCASACLRGWYGPSLQLQPDCRRALLQLIQRSVVLDHDVGACALLLRRHLRGHDGACLRFRLIEQRVQAAQHGRSMEDEARDILRAALSAEPVRGNSLVASIRRRVEALGGVELELPERDPIPEPPELGQ